jgi:hypothetical protein
MIFFLGIKTDSCIQREIENKNSLELEKMN